MEELVGKLDRGSGADLSMLLCEPLGDDLGSVVFSKLYEGVLQ